MDQNSFSTALPHDVKLPLRVRVGDLISRLTVTEKIGLLSHESPEIPRLGISFYSWWGEALHGHARGGRATVFPQAIGLAATFNPPLLLKIGNAIGDETRAKYHTALRMGNHTQFLNLTLMSPTVNILRDPRWGRNQETYGEDPWLTASLGAAFVRGLQGDDAGHLKTAAFAKHFAVHSGPEEGRYSFDARVSSKDLHETYLFAFRHLVEAGVAGIMGAYNAVNGEPCCLSKTLLSEILKKRWGFSGVVISDGGGLYWARAKGREMPGDAGRKAVDDWGFARDSADWSEGHARQTGHAVAEDSAAVAAMALHHGCDLDMGREFLGGLPAALERGLVTESEIDVALRRVLDLRFRLGMFDDDTAMPFTSLSEATVRCKQHVHLAYQAAVESTVLLKNADHVLPLPTDAHSILVGGPNAANIDSLLGSYYGQSPRMTTLMEGITGRISAGTSMIYTRFCPITGGVLKKLGWKQDRGRLYEYVIAAVGLSPLYEGEAGGDPEDSPHDGDRVQIGLPGNQLPLLKSLREHGQKLIVVVFGGSPVELDWVMANADAVLFAFYPGEQGGEAIADILFGKAAPSGRMPFTTPQAIEDLPEFHDYSMAGRTYRYQETPPAIPFGFGLTYTQFAYELVKLDQEVYTPGSNLRCTAVVRNIGRTTGEEVVQLYISHHDAPPPQPRYSLKGVRRITLSPGNSCDVTFDLDDRALAVFNETGEEILSAGCVTVTVAGACPDPVSVILGSTEPKSASFRIAH